jgi:hypothetical protein
MCPEVDWSSKNEYQVNPGGKGGRCVGLTTYNVTMSRNLGGLNLLEPCGLVQACNGTALPSYHLQTLWIVKTPLPGVWQSAEVANLITRGEFIQFISRFTMGRRVWWKLKTWYSRDLNCWPLSVRHLSVVQHIRQPSWGDLKRRVKSDLPSAGIIRGSPYSPR